MPTYAAKTGTQNFTDSWALVDATSANLTEASVNSYAAATTSYVACSAFTPGAITIDGVGVFIASTSLVGLAYARTNQDYGTFSVRLAQAGSTVSGTEVTVNTVDLAKQTTQAVSTGGEYGEIVDKISGSWVFFKFASPVTLLAATAYTLDIKKSNATGTINVGWNSGTNWMKYLRTTTTGTPAAGDRLFICGEITGAGSWSTNTVNHNSTDSSTTYSTVCIGAYGAWNWNTAASTNYYFKTNGDIRLGTLGQLQIGTSASPLPSTSTATIDFVSGAGAGCTLHCSRKSTLTMNGPTKTHYAYLRTNTAANATTASVSTSTSSNVDPGWKNGDKIIFGAYDTTYNSSGFWSNYDMVTLTADSSNWAGASSTNLQWTTSTNNSGTSQTGNWYAHETYLPWVANLTRNIVIKGASAANTCAITVNTDQINIVGVEMYFCDALYLRNGDGVTAGLVKNCVVREGRSVAVSNTNAGTGIVLRGCRNLTVEDCVAARGNGIYALWGTGNVQVITNRRGNLVKNCIAIANHLGNYNSMGTLINGECWATQFDGCITTSNNMPFIASKVGANSYLGGDDFVFAKNCHIALNNSSARFIGSSIFDSSWNNQQPGDGGRKLIINNCSFYSWQIDVINENVEFNDCAFLKRNPDLNYTQFVGNSGSANYAFGYPVTFNNCTFNTVTPGGAQRLLYIGYPCNWIFNGGSTNTNPGTTSPITSSVHGSKILFNNFSCANWSSAFPTSATSVGATNYVTGYSGYLAFQRFNQVEGDHRYYTQGYMSFSDSTVFDSSPRSLKVYTNLPGSGAKFNPIRIPLKKNQSATITAKIKMSEPGATGSNAFLGRIPSVVVRANRALGSNYNSDVEVFASSSAFNGDTSSNGWTPASLGSTNLRLWLVADPANLTYNSTSGLVSQWNDLSGNANHLTQSTDSKKPKYTVDTNHNGFSAVSLTREVDQRLVSSGNILAGNTSNVTIFCVGAFKYNKDETSGSTYGQFYSFNGATSRMAGWAAAQYTGNPSMYVGHVLDTDSATSNAEANDWHAVPGMIQLFTLQNNNGSSYRRAYINGARYNSQAGSSDTTATVNITPSTFSLGVGKESTYTQSATMVNHSTALDIFEFIVVDKVMTATEWADMNKYLANKYYIYLRGDKNSTTSWTTVSWAIPAVTDDTVVEACLNIRASVNRSQNTGFLNIDTITVT